MSFVSINWNPGNKDLKNFGWSALLMLPLAAVLLYWIKGLGLMWVLSICAAGVIIFLLSRISAVLVRPIYLVLTIITFPIGLVVSFIVMAAFYFLILTPVGLLFKLFGRDLLGKKFDRNAETYWVNYRPVDSVKRYFNQF